MDNYNNMNIIESQNINNINTYNNIFYELQNVNNDYSRIIETMSRYIKKSY